MYKRISEQLLHEHRLPEDYFAESDKQIKYAVAKQLKFAEEIHSRMKFDRLFEGWIIK